MKVNGTALQTIWFDDAQGVVCTFDQRLLPHQLKVVALRNTNEVATAISEMWLRGAPLIGAAAAYGMYFAACEAQNQPDADAYIAAKAAQLIATRPTAINLIWAVRRLQKAMQNRAFTADKVACAKAEAAQIVVEDVEICKQIGAHGLPIIEALSQQKQGATVNILTHCNAGWVACVDWGTATSPIYQAHDKGIKIHIWVDETRPRNQGAITAWELGQHGVPHTVITDNAGGLLMQRGMVDMCIVGTDRTTLNGDVCNKIGTYLKALAAHENKIPFYVALPSTTIDWELPSGSDIAIEARSAHELTHIQGIAESGELQEVRILPENTEVLNYGFDITPARYITALITERGVCAANETAIKKLFG